MTKVVVEVDESFESALKRKRKAVAARKKAHRRERVAD